MGGTTSAPAAPRPQQTIYLAGYQRRYFMVPDHAPIVLEGGAAEGGAAAAAPPPATIRVYKIVGHLALSPHAVLEKTVVRALLRDNAVVVVDNVTHALSKRDVEIIIERSAWFGGRSEDDGSSLAEVSWVT